MKKSILLSFSALLLMSSCATIVCGSKQMIQFDSTPKAALVTVDGVAIGRTPFQAKLKRGENHTVVITLDGFKTYETKLTRKFNGWYIGNIVFGGLIGIIVDPITGAIYDLSSDRVYAELDNKVVNATNQNGLYIGIAMEVDPSWKKIGQLEKI